MPEASELRQQLEAFQVRLGDLETSLRLDEKRERARAIDERMQGADFWNDPEKARVVVTELKALKGVLEPIAETTVRVTDALDLLDLVEEEGAAEELTGLQTEVEEITAEMARLETMALLSGPHDNEPCFFSIHTGAGGSDACEWAEMMLRMYTRFFERKGWKVEEISLSPGEEAGIKGADLRVEGPFAFGVLKGEIGVHRLVRISPFSGRRETSFAAVDAVPDYQQDINIEIDEKDLKIDRIHAQGKGGQHVNKSATAIRITHLPTGIQVAVQAERSQNRNKDLAMKILKSRLMQKAEAEREAQENARNATKMENAWGSQIRNYVLQPYTLVKDQRTACETGDAQRVLDGDLEPFVDAYLRWAIRT